MDSDQMRGYIQNFSFNNCQHGNQGYNRLLIQLFGYAGHGKSSFINSCKYVVDDNTYRTYAKVAGEGGGGYGGVTMTRSSYPLTDNITLVDNRGCATMNKSEIGAIYTQLGNFQPLDSEVNWHTEYMDMLTQLLAGEDRPGDFIAPVFVYSAKKTITNQDYTDLKEILTMAKDITKIFPVVVITHETSGHLPDIQEKFRMMGVQVIFSIENYTEQNRLKIRRQHEKILSCLHEIIKDVDFRMKERRNPREELRERKTILHTFLIEREREKVKEAAERAEAERRDTERREREERERREREEREKPWYQFW